MKSFVILITAIAAMAAAHGEVSVPDPGTNGCRQLRYNIPVLAARQEQDGAGPYVGPEDPPAKVRRQADDAEPYVGPEDRPLKARQEQDGAGPYGGPEPTIPALKNRQDDRSPTVEARQAENTGSES